MSDHNYGYTIEPHTLTPDLYWVAIKGLPYPMGMSRGDPVYQNLTKPVAESILEELVQEAKDLYDFKEGKPHAQTPAPPSSEATPAVEQETEDKQEDVLDLSVDRPRGGREDFDLRPTGHGQDDSSVDGSESSVPWIRRWWATHPKPEDK